MLGNSIREWVQAAGVRWDSVGNASINEKWSRLTNNANVSRFGTDEFGFSPEFVKRVLPIATLVHKGYFRVEVSGIENVPTNRVLLIANHSGQLPFDGMMIATSLILEPTLLEWFVPWSKNGCRRFRSFPRSSLAAVRSPGSPKTADDCWRQMRPFSCFPREREGISKTFDKRYQLQAFGQGFMRLALETNTPIVPVSVVGAEEQAPSFYNVRPIAKALNMPAFPITPTFPLLFPLGLLPLPVKYRIHFGEPLHFSGNANDEDAVIRQKVETVRSSIQSTLHTMVSERKHIFW